MKLLHQIHWLSGALLMTVFLLCTPMSTPAALSTGVLDGMEGGSVRGWAWNSADPASSPEVSIVITNQGNGQTIAQLSATACEYRQDLAAKGTGTGSYGFQVEVPWDTYGNGTYLVEAYAGGQKLTGSALHTVGEQTEAASLKPEQSLRSLGIFRTTAYCPCRKCSQSWGARTCTGTIASAGHTIAVDPRVIPFGTKVMINGTIYTAEDRGGAVKGNHIDIFFNTHGETKAYGTRNVEVFLVQ